METITNNTTEFDPVVTITTEDYPELLGGGTAYRVQLSCRNCDHHYGHRTGRYRTYREANRVAGEWRTLLTSGDYGSGWVTCGCSVKG